MRCIGSIEAGGITTMNVDWNITQEQFDLKWEVFFTA